MYNANAGGAVTCKSYNSKSTVTPCKRRHEVFGPDSESAPRSYALHICGRETYRGRVDPFARIIF